MNTVKGEDCRFVLRPYPETIDFLRSVTQKGNKSAFHGRTEFPAVGNTKVVEIGGVVKKCCIGRRGGKKPLNILVT